MKKGIITIVAVLLVILVVAGIIGIVINAKKDGAVDTDKFTADSMYLTINGENIHEDTSGFGFSSKNPLSVTVKFPLNYSGDMGYSFELVPNPTVDFSFYVGFERYQFADSTFDFSKAIAVSEQKNGFELLPMGNSITQLITSVVSNTKEDIHINESEIDYTKDLFLLKVTSSDSQKTIVVGIRFVPEIDKIELSQEEIIF